jgi:hypothetical protein
MRLGAILVEHALAGLGGRREAPGAGRCERPRREIRQPRAERRRDGVRVHVADGRQHQVGGVHQAALVGDEALGVQPRHRLGRAQHREAIGVRAVERLLEEIEDPCSQPVLAALEGG